MTRYRFFQPSDEVETGDYLKQMNAVDAFWQAFLRVCGRRASIWAAELRTQLKRLAPELGLEVREPSSSERRLYILPSLGSQFAPLARAFVERAPSVTGWSFGVEREPLDLATSLAETLHDQGLDLAGARVRVGVGRGHGLEVVVASERFVGLDQDRDLDAAHQLVNQLLGDRLMNEWVCHVSTLAQARPSLLRVLGADKQALPLELGELRPSVEAAIRGIDEGLPERPCHTDCEHAEWVMFDCAADASDADDAPANDLFMACTMRPEMLKWHLQGGDFSSRRFSRCGEHFCYLKLAGRGDVQESAERRVALEEQLDRWLVPGRLGCVVGAGPGRRFQYIQLALSQLDDSIGLLERQLRGHLDAPAWLLFCDTEWRHEWVGFGAGPP